MCYYYLDNFKWTKKHQSKYLQIQNYQIYGKCITTDN